MGSTDEVNTLSAIPVVVTRMHTQSTNHIGEAFEECVVVLTTLHMEHTSSQGLVGS